MADKKSWQIPDEPVKTAHLFESDEHGDVYRCPHCAGMINGKKSKCPSCGKRIECVV